MSRERVQRGHGASEELAREHLESWKQIAAYLKRGISTVQRWEKHEGLPVHRHRHNRQASVYAYGDELDAWWEQRDRDFGGEPSASSASTRLAVLPFQNLSGDADNEYLSDGLTEELITRLARIHPEELKVIARTSIMRYKGTGASVREIARDLKVDCVVEGSVRVLGDKLRITAQLIAARDEAHLWAEVYERPFAGIFDIHGSIVERIAEALALHLRPWRSLGNFSAHVSTPEAHEAYLRGRYAWNKRTPQEFRSALAFFQKAIESDPAYAAAYAGVADTYALLGFWGYGGLPPTEAMPRARAAALKALEIDDTLAEAHAALGWVRYSYEWDWPAAETAFGRALELNPSYATAHQWRSSFLAAVARSEEALAEAEIARELDPLSLVINHNVAWMHYFARRYDQCLEECRRTLEMNPDFPITYLLLGGPYQGKGMYREAIAAHERFLQLTGGSPIAFGFLGNFYGRLGDRPAALHMLDKLRDVSRDRYVPAFEFALVHTGLGESDEAFAWLEKGREERSDYLAYVKVEPLWDPLRQDPRFRRLLAAMSLET